MAADIGDRATLSGKLRHETPVPVRGQVEPVLQVGAVHREDISHLSLVDHLARVLDEGIVAIVEVDRVDDARLLRELDQLAALLARHGEGLFADHVLSGGKDVPVHLEVQMVRSAVVDHLNVGVVEQLAVVAVGTGDAERIGLLPREVLARLGQRDELDVAQSSGCLDVGRTDKAGANDPGADFFGHRASSSR